MALLPVVAVALGIAALVRRTATLVGRLSRRALRARVAIRSVLIGWLPRGRHCPRAGPLAGARPRPPPPPAHRTCRPPPDRRAARRRLGDGPDARPRAGARP